jgi:hypothetical protein
LILLFGAHLCAHGSGTPGEAGMPGVRRAEELS